MRASSGMLDRLARFDVATCASLDPTRPVRTPLTQLATSDVVATGLEQIATAIARHFPENVFADLDRIAAELEMRRARDGDGAALAHAERIARVHAVFGCETPLRFRYAHDFLYGFDWARWVAREPATRASIGPYDEAFLAYSVERAAELCALVATNDRKYGPLEGTEHRNPFPFRRDRDAESVLHLALAADAAVPVRAWDPGAESVWDRAFTTLREAKAHELHLAIARSGAD